MGDTQLVETNPSANTGGGAIVDLEFGSAADLRKKLDAMKMKLNLTKEFFREVMQEGVDYGVIPGTDKPALFKAGAEGLCEFYNLAPTIAGKVEDKSHDTGYYSVDITVRLIHRQTGSIIAEGVGHANTYESRYRWRWVYERDIPKGIAKEDLFAKEFNGRNSSKYFKYRIENDDMYSIWNTVLKMAKKRALVDAVLSATRSSGLFAQTQDELDAYLHGEDPDGDPEGQATPTPPRQNRQQSGGRTTQGSGSGTSRGANGATQKNRVLGLMKQQGLDWNGLAAAASDALGRDIKKVIQDIQTEADWKMVGDYLESGGQSEADFDDLPEDLR